MEKTCIVCGDAFEPDRYHPYQRVCFEVECRKKRRAEALRQWREKYPDYFRGRTDHIEKVKAWHKKHPEYYRKYRKEHPEVRGRTREYVRAHRSRRSKEGGMDDGP